MITLQAALTYVVGESLDYLGVKVAHTQRLAEVHLMLQIKPGHRGEVAVIF